MANNNIYFHTQRLSQGDIRRLAYAKFGLEVLTDMTQTGYFRPYIDRRPLFDRAKEVDFPLLGPINPTWHTPGTELLGDNIDNQIIKFTPDQILVSDLSVDWGEQNIGDYLYSSRDSLNLHIQREMAKGFARADDRQTAILLARAARGQYERASGDPVGRQWYGSSGYGNSAGAGGIAADVAGQTANGSAHRFSYDNGLKLATPVSAQDVADKLTYVRVLIAKKRLSTEGWICFIDPALYALLWNDQRFIRTEIGGRGSIAEGNILAFGGFRIIEMPELPSLDMLSLFRTPFDATNAGKNSATTSRSIDITPPIHAGADVHRNKYWLENPFCTASIIFHQTAIGRLDVMNIVHETEQQLSKLSSLSVTYGLMGGGVKDSKYAFEIAYSEPPLNPNFLTNNVNDYVAGYNDTD